MLAAFISARFAGGAAFFQYCTGGVGVVAAMAREDLPRGRADVDAVKDGADAKGELGDHLFTEACVSAPGARVREVEARLDSFHELGLSILPQSLG